MQTVLITGGTSGIGKATVAALLRQNFKIILIARNKTKALEVVSELKGANNIEILAADLASLKSIKLLVEQLKSLQQFPDIIINNAGGIFSQQNFTEDNFEWGFQVNHLAHFYLNASLLPYLKEGSRIINLSSEAHKIGSIDFQNLNTEKRFNTWQQYGATKLMNLLFTKALHHKFAQKGIYSFAVHPGVVRSSFGANNGGLLRFFNKMPFIISPEKGAETTAFLATNNLENLRSGEYYKKSKIAKSSKESLNLSLALKLWDISIAMLNEKGLAIEQLAD